MSVKSIKLWLIKTFVRTDMNLQCYDGGYYELYFIESTYVEIFTEY